MCSAYCVEFEDLRDEHDLRYSFLDWLNEELDQAIIGSSSIANGAKFTKLQRDYIWSLNCWNKTPAPSRASSLRTSTDGSDQYKDLNTKGCLELPPGQPHEAGEQRRDNDVRSMPATSSW